MRTHEELINDYYNSKTIEEKRYQRLIDRVSDALTDIEDEGILFKLYNELATKEGLPLAHNMKDLDDYTAGRSFRELLDNMSEYFSVNDCYFWEDLDGSFLGSFNTFAQEESPIWLDQFAEMIIKEGRAGDFIDLNEEDEETTKENALLNTAKRLESIGDTYEMKDNGETVETIADTLTNDPLSIINNLVDIIEDLNA